MIRFFPLASKPMPLHLVKPCFALLQIVMMTSGASGSSPRGLFLQRSSTWWMGGMLPVMVCPAGLPLMKFNVVPHKNTIVEFDDHLSAHESIACHTAPRGKVGLSPPDSKLLMPSGRSIMTTQRWWMIFKSPIKPIRKSTSML